MKVIIAGGRNVTDQHYVNLACTKAPFTITEVVSGCANGVDTLGEVWAIHHEIPIKKFPADWDQHGRRAGSLRNIQMGDYAQALIAVWDGKSRGTKHMIDYMKSINKPVYIQYV